MTGHPELRVKRERVLRMLDEHNLDGLLLLTPPSVSWITCGGDPVVDLTAPQAVAAVLCTRDGDILLTNTIEHARLLDEALPCPPARVEVAGWHEEPPPTVARRLAGPRLGVDIALPGFADCTDAVRSLRLTLTDDEVARYRALCRDAGLVIEKVAATLAPGMTELEIAGALAAETYGNGAAPIVALVAADDRISRYRHPIPTARVLERYALLVLCARRHGLVANVTRSVHIGPTPHHLRALQEACARVDGAFYGATTPGSTAGAVFAAAMSAYRTEGHQEEWRLHHQGGATGYTSREWLATPEAPYPIGERMAFAWNPSITGVKTEDTILLGSQGVEILTATSAWPTIDVTVQGTSFQRPVILER